MGKFLTIMMILYAIQLIYNFMYLMVGGYETKKEFYKGLNPFFIFILIYNSYKNLE